MFTDTCIWVTFTLSIENESKYATSLCIIMCNVTSEINAKLLKLRKDDCIPSSPLVTRIGCRIGSGSQSGAQHIADHVSLDWSNVFLPLVVAVRHPGLKERNSTYL